MASSSVLPAETLHFDRKKTMKSRNYGSVRSPAMTSQNGREKQERHSPIPQTTIKLGENIEWVPRPLQTPRSKDAKYIHDSFWHPMTTEQIRVLVESRNKKSATPPPKTPEKITVKVSEKNPRISKQSKSAPKPPLSLTTSGDFTKYVTTVLRRENSFKNEKRKQTARIVTSCPIPRSSTGGHDLDPESKRGYTQYCWNSKGSQEYKKTKEAPDYLYKFAYQSENKPQNRPYVPQINGRKVLGHENAERNAKGASLPHVQWSEDDSIDLANYMFSGSAQNKNIFFPHIGDYGTTSASNGYGSGLTIPAGYWNSGLGNKSVTYTGRWSNLAEHKLFPEYEKSKTDLKCLPSYSIYKENKPLKHVPVNPVDSLSFKFMGPWANCYSPILHANAPPNTADGPRPPRTHIDDELEIECVPAPPQSRIDNYQKTEDNIPRLRLQHGPTKKIIDLTMAGDMG